MIANYELIVKQKKKLRYNTNLSKINDLKKISNDTNLKILNIPLKFSDCFKISKVNTSKYVKRSLNLAHELCKQKKIKGFINCPIDKNLIKTKSIHGVTEFLGKKNLSKKFSEVMFLYNKNLSVTPITTHIKIKDISKFLNKDLIIKKD